MSDTYVPNLANVPCWKMLCFDRPRTSRWQLMLTQDTAHRVWQEWIKRHGVGNDGPFDQVKFDDAMRRLYTQLQENEIFISGVSEGGSDV
jgi:hypothetical protein